MNTNTNTKLDDTRPARRRVAGLLAGLMIVAGMIGAGALAPGSAAQTAGAPPGSGCSVCQWPWAQND